MSEDLNPSVIWYSAYANPPGVKVKVSDPNRAKTLLYTARAKLQDADLASLEIRTSPTDPKGELWIVNPTHPGMSDPSKVVDIGDI